MCKTSKQSRLKNANQLIKKISSCGRRFFYYQGKIARLELSEHGRIFFIDEYTENRIYTHNKNDWRGFTGGGTLRSFIIMLKNYVLFDDKINVTYWNKMWGSFSQNPWEYGDDIDSVKNCALRLGISEDE